MARTTRRQVMHRRQGMFALVIFCVGIFVWMNTAVAQSDRGSVSGLVTDPQGLAVRGVKITLTSTTTSGERETIADENGRYTLVGLAPGEYQLLVEGGKSFAPYENSSVRVVVGQETTLNVRL